MQLVLATRNQGKVGELKELLKEIPIEILSLEQFPDMPEVEEDGSTFAENALKKAKEVSAYTGLPAMADDSGLEVDYLQGAPGVYSARFAGEPKDDQKNNQKLLQLMQGVPEAERTARFRCAIAIYLPGEQEYVVDGTCEGKIAPTPKGEGGFGYDSLFYVPAYDQTFAQLAMDVKNKISHRGLAMQKAVEILTQLMKR